MADTNPVGTITPDEVLNAEFKAFGPQFQPAIGPNFQNTQDLLNNFLNATTRADTPVADINPWEVRVGGARFFVPPVNIEVSELFRSGSRDAALRQTNPARFNTGKSETQVTMTLYFPTYESIWGIPSGKTLQINFDTDPDDIIDNYMSSLRGLVTQFKYCPIVPVKSAYLNGVHNITAVALHSLTVSTVPGFPFCLVAKLTMLKFNHHVFLPMVGDFNEAIHWGRFRAYFGAAASKLAQIADQNFLTNINRNQGIGLNNTKGPQESQGPAVSLGAAAHRAGETGGGAGISQSLQSNTVNIDVMGDWLNGNSVELYYPDQDPALNVAPDLTYWKSNSTGANPANETWWGSVTKFLGIDANSPLTAFASAQGFANDPNFGKASNEYTVLQAWLKHNSVAPTGLNAKNMQEYVNSRSKGLTGRNKDNAVYNATATWLANVYQSFLNDPVLSKVFALQQVLTGEISIDEWEVPMRMLGINNPNVIVDHVSCTIGNNIVPMQLSLQDHPAYQHLGGFGTTVEISLTIFGEADVAKIRNMFDTINGLARLEHGHAVLGFFGIKNVITALMACKYAIPQEFSVKTLPNYPHIYNVTLTFLDFDVFQQKREMFSSEQEKQFAEAMSKKNPFLRIQQSWSAINCYDDLPLVIRDGAGKIIGTVDPDYYFRAFQSIDEDIVNWRQKKQQQLSEADKQASALNQLDQSVGGRQKHPIEYDVIHHMNITDEGGTTAGVGLHANGFDLLHDNQSVASDNTFSEPITTNTLVTPSLPGFKPSGGPDGTQHPYADKSDNPDSQFDAMMKDAQYRDKSGRMIRAFPTYMLWLISEDGRIFGQRAMYNFYGLQSVIDFSIVKSEDILGDVMILRLSNLYSRLSSNYDQLLNPQLFPLLANVVNHQLNLERNLLSAFSNYVVSLDYIPLAPGVRLHMRCGYGSSPNNLETVFNGVITEVELGDIVTVTCQSDAIELSAVVNNKSSHGDTGHLDGSLSGMWLSEPRDLMVRLLSMGGSSFEEAVAHLSHGMIFSENKFGIRHFGSILYDNMTDKEKQNQGVLGSYLGNSMADLSGFFTKGVSGAPQGLIAGPVGDLITKAWVNFNQKRDYELFRRNIYPGNGTGVSQYMGGDLGDGGVAQLFGPTGIQPGGAPSPVPDPRAVLNAAHNDASNHPSVPGADHPLTAPGPFTNPHIPGPLHKIMGLMHLVGPESNSPDLAGFQEVSFRASTYMKSVWDLFQLCAALLPNYIVAVRPYMDRSTVFYGKPHWMYTSGVIPLTTGLPMEDVSVPQLGPSQGGMDQLIANVQQAQMNPTDFQDEVQNASWNDSNVRSQDPSQPAQSDPTATTAGINNIGTSTPGGNDNPPGINVFMQAIRQVESGSNYTEGNGGAYQVLPSNWGNWKREAGVNDSSSTAEQASPAIQDQVAKFQMTGMYNSTHDWRKVAQIWNGGHVGANTTMVSNSPTGQRMHYEDAVLAWVTKFGGTAPGSSPQAVALASANSDSGANPGQIGAPAVSDLPKWITSNDPKQAQAVTANRTVASVNQYSVDFGFLPNKNPIPVDFTGGVKDNTGQIVTDAEGNKAYKVYKNVRSNDEANAVWNEFRKYFPTDSATNDRFNAHYGTQKNRFGEITKDFQQFMWQVGYRRGWIVLTADDRLTTADKILDFGDMTDLLHGLGNTVGGVAKTATDIASDAIDEGKSILNDAIGTVDGALKSGWDAVFGGGGGSDQQANRQFDFPRAEDLYETWLTQGPDAADQWMKSNDKAGYTHVGIIGRGIEILNNDIWSHITDFFKSIIKAVGSAVTGIVQLARLAITTLSHGLKLSSYYGKQAHTLNSVFNDSMYWNAGPPGSLLYYADNPETREYGEPVIEIREPFQRMHLADSFNHIICNNIKETQDNVATQVSATSSNKHPVTVYFDKSAPAEKQIVKSYDTGLYWDKPGLLGSIMHPSAMVRDFSKHWNGSEDETSAKRVGLWYLKKNLQQIYDGELLMIGDAGIRPYDLIYLDDQYERQVGMFEVGQVTHHFTPDMGFVTSVRPYAIVSINDPARWAAGSIARKWWATHSLRTALKHQLGVQRNTSTRVFGVNDTTSLDDLMSRSTHNLQNSQQYHGGYSSLIKGIGGMWGIGGIVGAAAVNSAVGIPAAFLGWKGFSWIRDHLLDAHGLTVEYLTRNGTPMDAGLSFNHGVAVGQVNALSLMGDALQIPLPKMLTNSGETINSMDIVLNNLGWNEADVQELQTRGISIWHDQTKAALLDLSGQEQPGAPFIKPVVQIVTVTGVRSGDTITVSPGVNGNEIIKLDFIVAPAITNIINPDDPGEDSRNFAEKSLITDQQALGYNPTIALRIDPTKNLDQFGRQLGVAFHNVPPDTAPQDRDKILTSIATDPNVTWDSYLVDGRPRTYNWQAVLAGKANVNTGIINIIPNSGVVGPLGQVFNH